MTVLILSLFLLDVKSDAGTPVQEICNPLEVLRGTTARGHRRGSDADATGRKRRGVARDRVAIQRYGRSLTHLLHCEGVGGVQGTLTLFCGGVAQTCHDDRVVELKEQLVVEEVDGERQEGKRRRERSSQRERTMDDMEMTM